MMLPTLKDLGVRIHSDIAYASGPADCDGELRVVDFTSRKLDWVELECRKCLASVAVQAPKVKRDMSWQERKDLA